MTLLTSCQQSGPSHVIAIVCEPEVEDTLVLPESSIPGKQIRRMKLTNDAFAQLRDAMSSGDLTRLRAQAIGKWPSSGGTAEVLVLAAYQSHAVEWQGKRHWCTLYHKPVPNCGCRYGDPETNLHHRHQYRARLRYEVTLGVADLITGQLVSSPPSVLMSDEHVAFDGFEADKGVVGSILWLATLGLSDILIADQTPERISDGLKAMAVKSARNWLDDQLEDLPSRWKSGRRAVRDDLLAQIDAMERRLPADYAGVISDVDDLRAQPVAVLVAERLDATKVLAEESRTQVREARAKTEREALAAKAKAEREALAAGLDGILALLPSRWREAERRFAQLRRVHPAVPAASGRAIQGWIALKRFQSLGVMDGDNGTIAGHLERIAGAFEGTPAAAEARRVAAKRRAASSQRYE